MKLSDKTSMVRKTLVFVYFLFCVAILADAKSLPESGKSAKKGVGMDFALAPPQAVSRPSGKESPLYYSFLIPTDFKQDRWIKKARFFLKAKIVHHIAFYIMDHDYVFNKKSLDYHTKALNMVRHTEFEGPTSIRPSVGIRLPKSSPLVLEIHYEPQGKPFIDTTSRVEIQFHRKRPKYELITEYYWTPDLRIPPYKSQHKVIRTYKVKETNLMDGLNLHMHLRGKAGAIFLQSPSSPVKRRIFGQDPFNPLFERFYRFKKPLLVEKGSIIECKGYFDNSPKNPLNPAPEKYALFGWTLADEMFNCVFKWLVPSSNKRGTRKRLFLRPFPKSKKKKL